MQRLPYRRAAPYTLSQESPPSYPSALAGLAGPLLYKQAVVAAQEGGTGCGLLLGALGASGLCRALSGIAADLQSLVFAPVAQV